MLKTTLSEPTAKALLARLGVEVPHGMVAADPEAAATLSEALRFPVVVKIVSPEITHKTHAGGVRTGLHGPREVAQAATEILSAVGVAYPSACVEGILVEEQIEGGVECIAGMARDTAAGPVVAFGAGGLLVEDRGDVVFGLAPLDRKTAARMVHEAEAAGLPALHQHRSFERLVEVLVALGRLVVDEPTIAELDINPLLVVANRVIAVDAVVRTDGEPKNGTRRNVVEEGTWNTNMEHLMAPASLAIIGASTNANKSGGLLLSNIVNGGYQGRIYPVNPHADSILGLRAYPSIDDLPEATDIAFIVLPRDAVMHALEACVRRGVRSAVVVTAGYGEVGPDGAADQARITELARASGLRVIGPNTIGMVCMPSHLLASIVPFDHWEEGDVAIFAQTGIFAGAPQVGLMSQPYLRLGVRFSVDVGNKPDVDEMDFLAFVAGRADVSVIGIYLESIHDPLSFLSFASQVKRDKPIVVLKPGRTQAGARASVSHTGSMATDDRVIDAGLRQCGLVRAADHEEFLALLTAFSWQPVPAGPRLGLVTYSGGLGAIAADEAVEQGLQLACWGGDAQQRLESLVPRWQPVGNPADLWVALDVVDARRAHEEALEAALADPGVDSVVAILLATPASDFDGFRAAFVGLRDRHPDKPLLLVIYGGSVRDRWMKELDGLRIPVFPSSRLAIRTLSTMYWYSSVKGNLHPSISMVT